MPMKTVWKRLIYETPRWRRWLGADYRKEVYVMVVELDDQGTVRVSQEAMVDLLTAAGWTPGEPEHETPATV